MTVIAWDGKTLSADKLSTYGGAKQTVTKIFKAGECLVGTSGDYSRGLAMVKWAAEGFDPSTFPDSQKSDDTFATVLVIRKGLPYLITTEPLLMQIEDPFTAIGSGKDFALAAMYMGANSAQAVGAASALCDSCGNGVDTLSPPIPE